MDSQALGVTLGSLVHYRLLDLGQVVPYSPLDTLSPLPAGLPACGPAEGGGQRRLPPGTQGQGLPCSPGAVPCGEDSQCSVVSGPHRCEGVPSFMEQGPSASRKGSG